MKPQSLVLLFALVATQATSAHGLGIVKTQVLGPITTTVPGDYQENLLIASYDPAEFNGHPLEAIQLTIDVTADGMVRFFNSPDGTTLDSVRLGATVEVFAPGALDLPTVPDPLVSATGWDVLAPPSVFVPMGQELTKEGFANFSNSATVTDAAAIAALTGPGSVPLTILGRDFLAINVLSGGGIASAPSVDVAYTVTVEYLAIPEPRSALLMAGMVIALFRCRVFAFR